MKNRRCAFNFAISSIFTASDPEVLAGQGASSHPTQEARLFRPRRPSIRQFRSNTAEIRTHMKGKVVLDNDGLSSGNFGQIKPKMDKAEIRTHMKGKVILDNDGLKSGRFGRTGSFFTSNTGGKAVLTTTALDPAIISRKLSQKDASTN